MADGPNVIINPVHTFADEYQVRDLVLSRSEQVTVRNALLALGLHPGHTPTGRYAQLALQQAMNVSLLNSSRKDLSETECTQWFQCFLLAKKAMGKDSAN